MKGNIRYPKQLRKIFANVNVDIVDELEMVNSIRLKNLKETFDPTAKSQMTGQNKTLIEYILEDVDRDALIMNAIEDYAMVVQSDQSPFGFDESDDSDGQVLNSDEATAFTTYLQYVI